MGDIGPVGLSIILINVLASLKGFNDYGFFNSLSFRVNEIIHQKDYKRLVTSGFIHVDFNHLLFNMLSLYFFADSVETILGAGPFILLYFSSLIGGNMLALYMNRHNGYYSAVGASGAVCGVIFAAIALEPGMRLSLIFLPIPFPGWLYGLAFIAYSIYGIRAKSDNIGHEAHLGGAIFGLLIAIGFRPEMLLINTLPIALVLIPSAVFFILLATKTDLSSIGIHKRTGNYFNPDDEYNSKRKEEEEELNELLEKINSFGIESLSQEEKDRLEELSK